ncbi:MAG: methyltransferase domain-containing protein [Deltaproteobacteria bacterium]|nr:methyltransferase domain-containing protein [Deltaproteobacteria bacterium]
MKDRIAAGFSKAADEYEQFALLQRCSVRSLHKKIALVKGRLPAGPVLEIGCGSGTLSRVLVAEMPERYFLLTDFSSGMLNKCRANFPDADRLQKLKWQLLDGENITAQEKFVLIVSGLTLQWFTDPVRALKSAGQALLPGGILLYSYLGDGSFPEWRAVCDKYQIPCTANPVPDAHRINHEISKYFSKVDIWEETFKIKYPGVEDFFYSLKKTGSGTPLNGQALAVSQMKALLKKWKGELAGEELEMTYNIRYIMSTK